MTCKLLAYYHKPFVRISKTKCLGQTSLINSYQTSQHWHYNRITSQKKSNTKEIKEKWYFHNPACLISSYISSNFIKYNSKSNITSPVTIRHINIDTPIEFQYITTHFIHTFPKKMIFPQFCLTFKLLAYDHIPLFKFNKN